ncbi:arylesterase [Marinobacter fonticola]|uniref:arylesterase n=1 Tax=Marinobacter fonticola TaxID=2603215 RepID=UPI001D0D9F55|nr:arylesterase [Marinobacter fonticola]
MFRRSIVFCFLALFAMLAQANQPTLLIMGDSLSAAYGVQTEKAWVSLLRQRLAEEGFDQWQVANASISGETTDGGERRLAPLLDRHGPEIVILELGGNDGLRGFPPKVTRDNLASMIEQSQQQGARVLLVGIQMPPNFGKRFTDAFAAIYPDLAAKYDTGLVPFFLQDVYNREGFMQDDGIHPTAQAQPALLDNVWPHLQPLLKTESTE